MKKLIVIIFFFIPSFCFAQYSNDNSILREAIVYYERDDSGFFQKKHNVMLDRVDGDISIYAYNKKTHLLYVRTTNSNCVITLNNKCAKQVKKDTSIPKLKEADIILLVNQVNIELEQQMCLFNEQRARAISDSIARAKADSIERVRQDSISRMRELERRTEYLNSHNWYDLPISGTSFHCTLCNEDIIYRFSECKCVAYKNDTIYFCKTENNEYNSPLVIYHYATPPRALLSNAAYNYHMSVFEDSLKSQPILSDVQYLELNLQSYNKLLDAIRRMYPYGYVIDWSWDDRYSNVTLNLSYFNTNKKAIKYIEIHYKITNAVGDVRKTGVFKGTGPVESFSSGTWDWDSSHYYVAGDAANMQLTQIVLTYMDGSKKTLPRNQIKFK